LTRCTGYAYTAEQVLITLQQAVKSPRQSAAFITPIGFSQWAGVRLIQDPKGKYARRLAAVINACPSRLISGFISLSARSKVMSQSQGVSKPVVHLPHDVELPIIFYCNQPVITLAMMDKAHRRPEGTAGRNFRAHQNKLIEGEDYFRRNSSEAKELGMTAPNGLILLTQTGYLMLVKSFTDDLAWQVQRELVKNYFGKMEKNEAPLQQKVIRTRHSAARIDIELHSDSSGDIHYIGLSQSNAGVAPISRTR
jgi:hypothetical protein